MNIIHTELIIMNPPYSKKDEFIEHALELAGNVFVILPLQVSNYISFTEERCLWNPIYVQSTSGTSILFI